MSVEFFSEIKRLKGRLTEIFLLENSHGEVTDKMLPAIKKVDKAIDVIEKKLKTELTKIHGTKKTKKKVKKSG